MTNSYELWEDLSIYLVGENLTNKSRKNMWIINMLKKIIIHL